MAVKVRTLLLLALMLALPLTPSRAQVPQYEQAPQYETDQGYVTKILNDYWTLQGLGQITAGHKANWSALLGSSDWYEWNSLKINWTSDLGDKTAQRRLLLDANITGLNAAGAQSPGYVWPSNGSEFWLCPHPHFDQMPRFICAVYNDYLWSRDLTFLRKMQPKAEAVMGYMADTMNGRRGLLVCPGVYTGLSNTGPNVTYMDCYREGGQVTWIEEGYYTALQDMAALETALGNKAQAAAYAAQARRFPAQFDAALWNKSTGRYAGWKDSRGALHDYGFTYLNLEALSRGLGSASDASRIFDWLDNGTACPTVMGGHKGSTNIYQCAVAPRSNTAPIPDNDWDFWSVSKSLRGSTMGYGALVEDGGAMLWVNYYDVMARLKWLDADSAWRKFADMLYRVAGDPLLFTEDVHHPTNASGENYLEVGPADGPENGLNGTAPLYGFMGISPHADGLYCSPNLPTSLLFLTSRAVNYGSSSYDIRVSRGQIVTDVAPFRQANPLNQAAPLTAATAQAFTAGAPFNKIGFCLTTVGAPLASLAVELQRRRGDAWGSVASAWVTVRYPKLYCYIPVPAQNAGEYRIILTPATGSAGWYHRNGRYTCRAALEPVTQTGTGAIGRLGAAFTAKRSFSDIIVRTTSRLSGNVTLARNLGGRWRPVAATWTAGVGGGVLGFADQPVGSYRLRFGKALTGTYRLLSNRYTITMTNGTVPKTSALGAGGTINLDAATETVLPRNLP